MKKTYFILMLLPIAFALIGLTAHAQVRNTDISLQITPAYPAPNQDVTATLSSQVTDLNKALITWSLNGQEKLSGIGKKTFQFNAGTMGTPTGISASIDMVDGSNITKNLSILPAEVDMLWEAPNSYVPPFYEGKALAVSQSKIKVVAIPLLSSSSGSASSSNLAYSWSQDGQNQTQASGWGNSSYTFQNSYLDTKNTLGVQVSDILGNTTASGAVTIVMGNPKIVFYPRDLTYGTEWESALADNSTVPSSGETITVAPYFFSETNPNSTNLSYTWLLNGQSINTPNPENVLSIKPTSGTSGTADIKLTIDNVNTLFQSISKEINVNF